MAPPKFKDLNKSAKDVLNKDYKLSGTSVELNSTASDGTSFKGSADRKGESITGDLEIGHKLAPGIKLTETWASNGNLNNKLEFSRINNLKVTGELLLKTSDMSNKVSLAAAYTNAGLNFNAKVSPELNVSLDATVAAKPGMFVGVSSGYGVSNGKVTLPAVTGTYKTPDWSIVGSLNLAKGTVVTADVHHKANDALQVAYNVNCNVDKAAFLMTAGVQYNVCKSTYYKARVNSQGVIGASYTQNLSDKVKFTLSAEIRNLASDDNKVGASFVFNQ